MRLLNSTLPRVRRLFQGDSGFTLSVVLVLGALEFLGHRQTTNDLHDTFAVVLFAAVIAALLLRHRHRPLPWLTNLIAWAKRTGEQVYRDRIRIELGHDLRGEPELPRRMPRGTFPVIAVLIAWIGLAMTAWYWLPAGWRPLGTHGFYLGYLIALTLVWSGLLVAIFVSVAVPMYQLHQWLSPDREAGSRTEWVARIVYLGLVFTAAWRLSVLPVLGFCVAVAVVCSVLMAVLPQLGREQLIWRDRPGATIWSVPSRRLVMALCLSLVLFQSALIVTASGSGWAEHTEAAAQMPVTTVLGSLTAWLTPGLCLALTIELFAWWRNNPARGSRPVVHVLGGHLVPPNRGLIRRCAARLGWRVRWDHPPSGEPSVAVELVEPNRSRAEEFDPPWPLPVSVADLERGEVFERIDRRREIRLRRDLLRGFERLFKSASKLKKRDGSGCWLGPHLWFMTGMVRDEAEPSEGEDGPMLAKMVGEPYDRIFHRASRQYSYRLFRALKVDLIFVEDGVNFRRFQRVMRVMFELFDRFAESRRAEETHFSGLPKVRVMLHDFTIDRPFRNETYPEPRFEDLGRARILHVFRDRGGQEDYVEPPGDFSRSPAPVLVG